MLECCELNGDFDSRETSVNFCQTGALTKNAQKYTALRKISERY